jgi:hypothetical protein
MKTIFSYSFSGVLSAIVLLANSSAALACATCGCALSSDAAMGFPSEGGWLVSVQYDFINQSQYRHGTGALSSGQVASINDNGGSQEVENGTLNRYTTLGISYAVNQDWNFRLLLPYMDRSHSTYGQGTNPLTPSDLSYANVSSVGDVKLISSYQGLLPTHNWGFQLGLKLPTGDYGGSNATGTGVVGRSPVSFSSGPIAGQGAGALLDTSLQAGNGSTDLILGSYYFQPVSQDFDAFVSGQFQSSVAHQLKDVGADYRPGNSANISFGLRYEADPSLVPQLQFNVTHKTADQGALADTSDTAGTVVYLSPGITAMVGAGTHAYAFVQWPLYSQLAGYQLFPKWTASVGVAHSF